MAWALHICRRMSVSESIEVVAHRFSRLLELHIRLARQEVAEDVRTLARQAAVFAALIPVALLGYVLLVVAAVAALHRVMPLDLALVVVGGVHLIAAIVGTALAVQAMKKVRPLEQTRDELSASIQDAGKLVPAAKGQLAPQPRPEPALRPLPFRSTTA